MQSPISRTARVLAALAKQRGAGAEEAPAEAPAETPAEVVAA
jgi:large subunit ribosomal protein L10